MSSHILRYVLYIVTKGIQIDRSNHGSPDRPDRDKVIYRVAYGCDRVVNASIGRVTG